jgi:predicted PurR-regulated permease PerM
MTFIMSHVAFRAVRVLTPRDDGSARARRVHQAVCLLVYLVALAVGGLTAYAIGPRAIEQGKWLLGRLPTVNLERIRDEVMAKTLGRLEYSSFRRSPEFEAAFQEFRAAHRGPLGFQAARELAGRVQAAFEDDLLAQETARVREQLRKSVDFPEQYRQWLLASRAPQELATNSELRERLVREYDASFTIVNGPEAFEQQRARPEYLEKRQAANVQRAATELAAAGRDRELAEAELAARSARERMVALTPAERQERFRAFYQNEVPRLFPGCRYSLEEFGMLEQCATEEDFRKALHEDPLDESTLRERFRADKELDLGRKHALGGLLGDTSQFVRSSLPVLTGWLTNAVNNVLDFCFNALLSLTLSFIIVWEIPDLRRGLQNVRGTRAETVLEEIGPGMARLATVVATGFSAQFVIAVIDALAAFIVFTVLGLPSPVFLSLLVLVCCLVPYVGMFIAAVPILIVALQQGGLQFGLTAAFWLLMIHELEAWILSPRILGEFLRLRPMFVILVLFVAQPVFGIWGLILGVPVAVFLLNDVLLRPAASPDPAA